MGGGLVGISASPDSPWPFFFFFFGSQGCFGRLFEALLEQGEDTGQWEGGDAELGLPWQPTMGIWMDFVGVFFIFFLGRSSSGDSGQGDG